MSSSVIGGGSACGSSLNFLGRILFGFDVFADFVIAKSIDFEPWDLPVLFVTHFSYCNDFGTGSLNLDLRISCPIKFSGFIVYTICLALSNVDLIGLLANPKSIESVLGKIAELFTFNKSMPPTDIRESGITRVPFETFVRSDLMCNIFWLVLNRRFKSLKFILQSCQRWRWSITFYFNSFTYHQGRVEDFPVWF